MSAMKRDDRRRWRLLTLVGALGGCCDARAEVVADALRTCLDFAFFGLVFEAVAGCAAADVDCDLLLEACACCFAKVTPFEARF